MAHPGLAVSPLPPPLQEPAEGPAVRRASVLVVDDEPGIVAAVGEFLARQGFEVAAAGDGVEALERMEAAAADLLLVDLKMPRMGGIELLERVRERWPSSAVVIMTGYATVETALDCMKKGACDYVLKPFRVREVVRIFEKAMESRRLREENLRLKETLSLYQAFERFDEGLSVDRVLELASASARSSCGADLACVFVHRGGDGDAFLEGWDPPGAVGERDAGMPGPPVALSFAALEDAFRAGRLVLARGAEVAAFLPGKAAAGRVASLVGVPIKARGRVVGGLVAVGLDPVRSFDEGHRRTLSILAGRAGAAVENAWHFEDLKRLFRETVEGFAVALETKDRYTSGHSERVRTYARMVARAMGLNPVEVDRVGHAAILHDIGKLGIRSQDLHKLSPLTPAEFEVLMSHPGRGRRILEPVSFLADIVPYVYYHHERWDGRGYPEGLTGPAIPLGARILAVADAYDAMTSDRPYRKARRHLDAVAELRKAAGTQFDPEVVETFLTAIEVHRRDGASAGSASPPPP